MSKNQTWYVLGIAAIVAVAGMYFLSSSRPDELRKKTEPKIEAVTAPAHIKWGGPKNISMLPLVAQSQGSFTKNKIVAEYVDLQTGKKAMDALRTGDIDLGVLVDSNLAFAGYEQADDLRVFACIMTKRDDALIVAKAGFENPSSLLGQTIGVTLGTTTHAYLVQWLEANGLKPAEVKLQNMPPPAIQAALLNGSLKAGCLWQPFRFNVMAAKPADFTELKDQAVYTSFVLLVGTKRFLNTEGAPVAITGFVKALVDAEAYVAKNQDSSRIIGEKLGVPVEVMKTIWSEYDLRVLLSNDVLDLLGREGKWISGTVAEYLNKSVPDYRPFLYPQILRSIDVDRVKGL